MGYRWFQHVSNILPIGSMYGIYSNIWGILMVNVAIYGIHGYYGLHKFVQLYGRCDPHIFGEQSTATGLCARGDEAVFAFSPNPDSHAIILQHYGNFADVYVAMAEKNVENLHPKMKNFRYSICRPSPKPTFLVGE